LAHLSRIALSVAYTLEEICKKSCNEPKSVVTLHRQKEQKEFLRQKEKEIKHLNNNN
jgi:hypothetical protein